MQRIMVANIEEVLQRGEALSGTVWLLFGVWFLVPLVSWVRRAYQRERFPNSWGEQRPLASPFGYGASSG